jgi:tRNA(fMet)-specific endonuclease VapC
VAGWLIDTSVLVDAERGRGALARVPEDDEHAISVVTVSELLHGVHRASNEARRTQRQAFVEHVLAHVDAIPVTTEVARVHADLWARMETAGEVIGLHDLWIAATALAFGIGIATSNARDFQRVPGLPVLPV